ncbi:MAG: carboxypeptidase M32 [Gammaproteobacteria bacterium]|nr:carboxypeptidase M32 [Gammaproteobacteria bacterium]
MSYTKLEKTFYRLSQLSQASSFLGWDQQVMMPAKGNDSRGQALAELSVIATEIIQSPELEDAFAAAEEEVDLEPWQKINLSKMREKWLKANAVPKALVEAQAIASNQCEYAWRSLRKQNNWKDFEPQLTEIFNLSREHAQALVTGLEKEKTYQNEYEALLDLYDPGTKLTRVDDVFDALKQVIPELLHQVLERQRLQPKPTRQSHSIDKDRQVALSKHIMSLLGFDFDAGRLDEAAHPFSGGSSDDSRITTRYSPDNVLEGLMGIIHETGHARYESGLPKAWRNRPIGQSMGMGVHESQSLFFEMQVGRSEHFIQAISPKLQQYLGRDPAFETDNLLTLYRQVTPGLIRVNADEVTYPLHVILRYEIERDIILGRMEVKDIPERWNEAMLSYLGLDTRGNFTDGPMQDIHWPSGAIGYFPSYTLGALTAAQLFSSLKKDVTDVDDLIGKLEFTPIFNWLEKNIWHNASSLNYDELMTQVTGETLNTEYFIDHLKNRYL